MSRRVGAALYGQYVFGDFCKGTVWSVDEDHSANDPLPALEILQNQQFAVIISDQQMPSMTGLDFLTKAKLLQPDASRMLITAVLSLDTVIDAINRGEKCSNPSDQLKLCHFREVSRSGFCARHGFRFSTNPKPLLRKKLRTGSVGSIFSTMGVVQGFLVVSSTCKSFFQSLKCLRATHRVAKGTNFNPPRRFFAPDRRYIRRREVSLRSHV